MTFKLTEDKQERKQTPIFSGVVAYFPLSLAAMARVSWTGNEQHNPGEPLHWSRSKSDDHLDAAQRHMLEYAMGNKLDSDGEAHLAKAMWRIGAQLQLDEEGRLSNDGWREGTLWDVRAVAQAEYDAVAPKTEDRRPNVHAQMRELRLKDD